SEVQGPKSKVQSPRSNAKSKVQSPTPSPRSKVQPSSPAPRRRAREAERGYDRPMPELPRVVSSETVYRGRLFNVELDQVDMGGGIVAYRETIRHPGAVGMVAVCDDGRLLLVTQY